MKRLLSILSALVLAQAASATQLFVDAPNDGYLNLRSGPSTGYEILHRMAHGSQVEVLEAPGKWLRVQHESGHVGWASSRFLIDLSQTRPAPEPKLDRFWVDAPGYSGLNLRAGPSTAHEVLLTMAQGARVEELGRQGKWRLLRHEGGQIGWAHGAYLSDTRPHARPDRYREKPGWQPHRDHKGWRNHDRWRHKGQRHGSPDGGPRWNDHPDRRGRQVWRDRDGDDAVRDRHNRNADRDRKPRNAERADHKRKRQPNTTGLADADMLAILNSCAGNNGQSLSRCLSDVLIGLTRDQR